MRRTLCWTEYILCVALAGPPIGPFCFSVPISKTRRLCGMLSSVQSIDQDDFVMYSIVSLCLLTIGVSTAKLFVDRQIEREREAFLLRKMRREKDRLMEVLGEGSFAVLLAVIGSVPVYFDCYILQATHTVEEDPIACVSSELRREDKHSYVNILKRMDKDMGIRTEEETERRIEIIKELGAIYGEVSSAVFVGKDLEVPEGEYVDYTPRVVKRAGRFAGRLERLMSFLFLSPHMEEETLQEIHKHTITLRDMYARDKRDAKSLSLKTAIMFNHKLRDDRFRVLLSVLESEIEYFFEDVYGAIKKDVDAKYERFIAAIDLGRNERLHAFLAEWFCLHRQALRRYLIMTKKKYDHPRGPEGVEEQEAAEGEGEREEEEELTRKGYKRTLDVYEAQTYSGSFLLEVLRRREASFVTEEWLGKVGHMVGTVHSVLERTFIDAVVGDSARWCTAAGAATGESAGTPDGHVPKEQPMQREQSVSISVG